MAKSGHDVCTVELEGEECLDISSQGGSNAEQLSQSSRPDNRNKPQTEQKTKTPWQEEIPVKLKSPPVSQTDPEIKFAPPFKRFLPEISSKPKFTVPTVTGKKVIVFNKSKKSMSGPDLETNYILNQLKLFKPKVTSKSSLKSKVTSKSPVNLAASNKSVAAKVKLISPVNEDSWSFELNSSVVSMTMPGSYQKGTSVKSKENYQTDDNSNESSIKNGTTVVNEIAKEIEVNNMSAKTNENKQTCSSSNAKDRKPFNCEKCQKSFSYLKWNNFHVTKGNCETQEFSCIRCNIK